MNMQREALLQLHNVSVHYGGVKALDGLNVSIDDGEIVALMGPNGAGKSTILKAIFGFAPIHSGEVRWHGRGITPISHEVVRRGITFIPQGRRVFSHLTVAENLEIGGMVVGDKNVLKIRIAEVLETFPILKQRRKLKAGALSGGEQQMLALARCLTTEPKVLLLDEPSLGLAPKIVKEIFSKIKEINHKHKTAIMVVEHNITSLLSIASRGYVLDKGKVVSQGSSQELLVSGVLERVFVGRTITPPRAVAQKTDA